MVVGARCWLIDVSSVCQPVRLSIVHDDIGGKETWRHSEALGQH
jgi:hypothetical protein